MPRIVTRKIKKPKAKKMILITSPSAGNPDEQSKVSNADWQAANKDWKANAPKEFANLLEAKKA